MTHYLDDTAIIYPGQGAQAIAIAKEMAWPNSKTAKIFDLIKEKANLNLWEVLERNDPLEISQTRISQPLLFALGVGMTSELLERFPAPLYYAGLSLGEYTALAASNIAKTEELIPLLAKRATAMDIACQENPGAMAAVVGMPAERIEGIIAALQLCSNELIIANYNTDQQFVLSGSVEAITAAVAEVKKLGGKAIPLKVQGAFHSPKMRSARDAIATDIMNLHIHQNSETAKIAMNYSGYITEGSDTIRLQLREQVSSPTYWHKTILSLYYAGVRHFIEIGSGNTLSKMIEKMHFPEFLPRPKAYSLQSREDIQKFSIDRPPSI